MEKTKENQIENLGYLDMLGSAAPVETGKRGRPTGPKKVKKEDVKELTLEERFMLLKQQLLADLRAGDLHPEVLKDIIERKQVQITDRHQQQGEKLWAKILLKRGKLRDELIAKGKGHTTVFGKIQVTEMGDGLHMVLPAGMSFMDKKSTRKIELINEMASYEAWHKIGI